MNFANLSLSWMAAGLAGLAALLYALHQLRVRYEERQVVTTLFWREALQAAPARVFLQRFRHPWAYLLILLICSLLWLALAEPQLNAGNRGEHHVLVLDGSAGMARGDRFEQAVATLKADASRLPAAQREVLWVGGSVRTLLAPGEHHVLLERRLEGLAPEAAPSSLERQLRQLARLRRGGQAAEGGHSTSVYLYGDAPVRPEVLELTADALTVQRAMDSETVKGNAGITALGLSEAASGAWTAVDVFVRALREAGEPLEQGDLAITLDGAPLTGADINKTPEGGWLIRDVPAQGGLLEVRLQGEDVLGVDNSASLQLPNRPLIKVALSPSLEEPLAIMLASDSAVTLTADDPDVIIRRQSEGFGSEAAQAAVLEFAPAAQQEAAFLLTYPGEFDSGAVLVQAMHSAGLSQIDATALASVAQRPIGVSVQPGAGWRFSVWEEFLTDQYNFTLSRSFPIFMSQSLRWLASTPALYPYAAAGQPLSPGSAGQTLSFANEQGVVIDTLGAPFTPTQAGELAGPSGARALSVSLLDPATTRGEAGAPLEVARASLLGSTAPLRDLVTVLLVLALLLLSAEWWFYRQSRMP